MEHEPNNNEEGLELTRTNHLRLVWVPAIFIHPRRTLGQVIQQGYAVWFTPLVILTALALVLVRVSGIPHRIATQITDLPPDYEYYSPEQQAQFQQALAARSSRMMIYGLPAMGETAGIWLGWLLTGSTLLLALSISGSSSKEMGSILNLTAWSMMPLALRYLVRSGDVAVTQNLISSPGLAGFAPAGGGGAAFLAGLLGQIDFFYIWHVILLGIGAVMLSNLGRKAWIATLAAVLVVMLLSALPGMIMAQLNSLGGSQPIFFF